MTTDIKNNCVQKAYTYLHPLAVFKQSTINKQTYILTRSERVCLHFRSTCLHLSIYRYNY